MPEFLSREPDRYGAQSSASVMDLNGTWAASFTSLVTDALGASNRHRQRDSLGRKVLRMRRTAYHHLEGSSYIERFHRSLKEEEV